MSHLVLFSSTYLTTALHYLTKQCLDYSNFSFFVVFGKFYAFPPNCTFQETLVMRIRAYRNHTSISYRQKLDQLGKGLHVNSTLKIMKLSRLQKVVTGIRTDVSRFSKNWKDVTDRSNGSQSKWLYKNLN